MNRPIGLVQALVSSDNALYATYYQQVGSAMRLPQDSDWDRGRESVDSLLFPHYHEHIHFAALSLDGHGVRDYGEVSMTWRDVAIRHRATAFEENSRLFVRRRGIVAGEPVPPGYRSTWDKRGDLATAKLSARLTAVTRLSAFPGILMEARTGASPDFVEVHIYGPLHRKGLEMVRAERPARRADRVLLEAIAERLAEVKVPLEVLP